MGSSIGVMKAHTKEEVRDIARKYGLDVSDKADSQDFYNGDINDIIQETPKPGNFINKDGKVLGKHLGIWNYTIGQRRGLGISADRPLYVIGLNKENNEVVLDKVFWTGTSPWMSCLIFCWKMFKKSIGYI